MAQEIAQAKQLASMQAAKQNKAAAQQAQAQQMQEKAQQMEAQRQAMLKSILSNEARTRLSNIKMVKPERAKSIEDQLLKQMSSGLIGGKVTEAQIKQMLDQLSQQSKKVGKITFARKLDDDDDIDENYWSD